MPTVCWQQTLVIEAACRQLLHDALLLHLSHNCSALSDLGQSIQQLLHHPRMCSSHSHVGFEHALLLHHLGTLQPLSPP
jgi:hypothetical protein